MAGERVWVKNPDTGAVREVAESALPQLAQSNWQQLSDAEVTRHHKAHRKEKAEVEAAMTPGLAAPDTGGTKHDDPPAEGTTPEKES